MIGQKGIPATFGGVERHVEELSASLVARGHQVTAFVRPSYTDARGAHRGVRLWPLPSIPTKHLDAITHTALCTVTALCEDFDLFHYHAVGPSLLSCVPRCLGRRVVATVHALDWRRAKWGSFARWALQCGAQAAARAPHQTIAVSSGLADFVAGLGRRATVIPNGVALLPPRPLARLKRFGLERGRFVLWLGRFTPEKRCQDLIEAFQGMTLDVKLVLAADPAGGGAYLTRLREQAAGDERVVFAGGLYGEDKAEALSNAGLFVLPSELEGLPVALLEAMRAGVCALASDIGPAREVITPGQNGMLHPVGNVAALRRGIEQAFARPDETAAMAARAAKSLGPEYNWDRIAEQTEAVYEKALGSRRS